MYTKRLRGREQTLPVRRLGRLPCGYIKSLGVTSIELMPVHTFFTESQLTERGLSTTGLQQHRFFALTPLRLDRANTLLEFRILVARFPLRGSRRSSTSSYTTHRKERVRPTCPSWEANARTSAAAGPPLLHP